MFLKNYTSNVPVSRTIARIEELIAEAGAVNISKDFANGTLTSLRFSVDRGNGKLVHFKMPSKPDAVFAAMWKEVRRPRSETKERLQEQAARTAWKLLQDDLEIQVTKLKLQQVEFLEIFLAYVWDGEQTLFEKLKAGGFRALPEKCES